jgi:hypothetical protein
MGSGEDRRRQRRVPIKVPVRVQGRDPDGTTWEEMSTCEDASVRGVGLFLSHAVRQGQVLHLSVPLPSRFRQFDVNETSYHVYAVVRHTRQETRGPRIGTLFLGRHPPRGATSLPTELYFLPGDPLSDPAVKEGPSLLVRLEADQAPGGVAQEERVQAEQLGPREAVVKVTRLPVAKGAIVSLTEVGGEFRTRAEVHGLSLGADGQPRLTLVILDQPVPARLVAGAAAEAGRPAKV